MYIFQPQDSNEDNQSIVSALTNPIVEMQTHAFMAVLERGKPPSEAFAAAMRGGVRALAQCLVNEQIKADRLQRKADNDSAIIMSFVRQAGGNVSLPLKLIRDFQEAKTVHATLSVSRSEDGESVEFDLQPETGPLSVDEFHERINRLRQDDTEG